MQFFLFLNHSFLLTSDIIKCQPLNLCDIFSLADLSAKLEASHFLKVVVVVIIIIALMNIDLLDLLTLLCTL